MNRRDYLATTMGLGVAALAGCTTASGSLPAPDVDQSRLDDGGWELTEDTSETVFEREYAAVLTVTATARTVTYENSALQDDLADRTLGNVDFAPANFFATRVGFSPSIDRFPGGAGRKELLAEITDHAKTSFQDRLDGMGLTEIEQREETTLEIETGETADAYRYRAVYPFESFDIDLAGDWTLTVEGGRLPVEGWLAVWHNDASVLLAGGGYPAANVERTAEESLTDGIDVELLVDLGLEPDTYEEELLTLVAGVE